MWAPSVIISEVTPRLVTGTEVYCLLSEKRQPVRMSPMRILELCTLGAPRVAGSAGALFNPTELQVLVRPQRNLPLNYRKMRQNSVAVCFDKKNGYGKVWFPFLAMDERRYCQTKLIWLQRTLSLTDIACQANRTDNHQASVRAICYLQTCNKFNTIIPSLSNSK